MADPSIPAFRCTKCDINWPALSRFNACPLCKEPTWRANRTQPLTQLEAEKLCLAEHERREAHRRFDRYYEEREIRAFRAEMADAKW